MAGVLTVVSGNNRIFRGILGDLDENSRKDEKINFLRVANKSAVLLIALVFSPFFNSEFFRDCIWLRPPRSKVVK